VEGVDILEKIKESKAKDDDVVKAVEEMKRAQVKMLRDEEWREEDSVMNWLDPIKEVYDLYSEEELSRVVGVEGDIRKPTLSWN